MIYDFPVIERFDDVLPHIEGRPEFSVLNRDGYLFVNYNVIEEKTFDLTEPGGAIRREMRGIAFEADTGRIASRCFQKFFNYRERKETQAENIDWSQGYTPLEKLDGSMVRPLVIDGQLVLTTKRGLSDASMDATNWMREQGAALHAALRKAYDAGVTPIMEWVGPSNQIVVKYSNPRLVLLAVRDNRTGAYLEDDFGIPLDRVQEHPRWASWPGSFDEKIDRLRQEEGEEGIVVRFPGGGMMKAKNAWYSRIHYILSEIYGAGYKRHVVQLILDEQLDDVMPFLHGEKRKMVQDFERDFWHGFHDASARVANLVKQARASHGQDQKAIATQFAPSIEDPMDKKLFFMVLKGRDLRQCLLEHIEWHAIRNIYWERCEAWLMSPSA